MSSMETMAVLVTLPPAVLGATVFLARILLNQAAVRDLEKYKRQLENEVSAFKADLDKLAFEHQTKFFAMHERRAEVIAHLYGLIQEAKLRMHEMTAPMQVGGKDAENDRRTSAAEAYNAMADYFTKNRIYLAAGSANRTQRLIKAMQDSFFEYLGNGLYGTPSDIKVWIKAWNRIKDDVAPALEALEIEFSGIRSG